MIFGPIGILLAWVMFGYVYFKMRHLKHPTLSKLAASDKKTYLIFAITLSISGILAYIFMLVWFIPELKLSWLFTLLVTLAIPLQIVTAWVPDTVGWKHEVHHNTAWAEAWLLLPMALMISLSQNLTLTAQLLCGFFVLIMVILAITTAKIHGESRFVYSQGAYIICFHAVVLTATVSRLLA